MASDMIKHEVGNRQFHSENRTLFDQNRPMLAVCRDIVRSMIFSPLDVLSQECSALLRRFLDTYHVMGAKEQKTTR